jgi:hypothetical protein
VARADRCVPREAPKLSSSDIGTPFDRPTGSRGASRAAFQPAQRASMRSNGIVMLPRQRSPSRTARRGHSGTLRAVVGLGHQGGTRFESLQLEPPPVTAALEDAGRVLLPGGGGEDRLPGVVDNDVVGDLLIAHLVVVHLDGEGVTDSDDGRRGGRFPEPSMRQWPQPGRRPWPRSLSRPPGNCWSPVMA